MVAHHFRELLEEGDVALVDVVVAVADQLSNSTVKILSLQEVEVELICPKEVLRRPTATVIFKILRFEGEEQI